MSKIEFEGKLSGDGEAFCWDVSYEVFMRVLNKRPLFLYDHSYYNFGLYRLYPNDIFINDGNFIIECGNKTKHEIERSIICTGCKQTYQRHYFDYCPKCNTWTLFDTEKNEKV